MLKEYRVLVPTAFQDGTEIPQETLTELAELACEFFNGLTIEAPATGYWWDFTESALVEETMTPWVIASQSYANALTFAERVRTVCKQKCVYLRLPDGRVKLV